jgi:signal transduction histidine kinase
MNPLIVQLTHRPFPEVADALRASVDQITLAWDAAVRKAMPQMQRLTIDELKDSTPQILVCMADALASDDPKVIEELIERAPAQGLSRFRLNFDVVEVMQEDRLLRAITVEHVEAFLDRTLGSVESAALHTVIDVMLQRSVIAMVEQQKAQLKVAAETELKFLSFLAHDLNNNLNSITMTLLEHGMDLKKAGGFAKAQESLALAQQMIFDTVNGMRRMLDHERLRKQDVGPTQLLVDLHALAEKTISQFRREAAAKAINLEIGIMPGSVVESDPELLSLILQNLVGNSVKYSSGGTVRIGFDRAMDRECWVIWVSDEGYGIDPEKIGHIFQAFNRGEIHGQQGQGLGLAIASQAAKLLGAELEVESKVGTGTTIRLTLVQSVPKLMRGSSGDKPQHRPLSGLTRTAALVRIENAGTGG